MTWNGANFVMFALLCGVRLVMIQILLLSRGVLNINTLPLIRCYVVTAAFGNLPGMVVVVCVCVASVSRAEREPIKRNVVVNEEGLVGDSASNVDIMEKPLRDIEMYGWAGQRVCEALESIHASHHVVKAHGIDVSLLCGQR